MANFGEGSGKKKLVYFEDKNMAEAYAEFKYDIGNLVRKDCSAEFESWKKVPEELKKSLLGELSGLKFSKIDIFADVYVQPGNELTKSLHHSQSVLQESASQLPSDTLIKSVDPPEDAGFHILTETLDQTFS
ncbi:hypothetical protein D8674_018023 [Pyrus ussuriensis x Pyrus communis]|uniref:Uncharacterized protein n=1 Tax=Pyrus ussuriensis x Pyrus communis TaxID=2448454 RepID=A0A5N5HGW1_9ROSA|nr:hypothetical protein D8674_017493 [Pyrus ussuriensis x Pyrus communis]KAB2626363.1 hypothetical protein D8674_018023 [Pyrus ussuriensis x Pyrus communis]